MHRCDLFISACEPSGDLHGAEILKSLYPYALNIHGVAGPKMRSIGMHTHFRAEEFNVMGFTDVVMSLPKLVKLFKKVRAKILHLNPKIVVLIDYPGFHLKMAKSLRKKGFKGKICQYVCPSVWAWRKNRIHTMSDNLDLLLTLFPFEPQYFEQTPLEAHFVGHPLSKTISSKALYQKKDPNLLAIFPGSRRKEIQRNLSIQLKACHALKKLTPSLDIQISVADPHLVPMIDKLNVYGYKLVMPEKTYALMSKASYAVATSGTVTLELALHNIAAVTTYGLSRFDQFIATKIFNINLPFYCIVNIVLNECLYPELIGTDLTPLTLLKALKKLIDTTDPEMQRENSLKLKNALTEKDSSVASAQEIIKLL